MGKRSPHEATAEASRPTVKSALAVGVRTHDVVDMDSFHERLAHLAGESGPRERASGELTALPGATRPISLPLAKLDYPPRLDCKRRQASKTVTHTRGDQNEWKLEVGH